MRQVIIVLALIISGHAVEATAAPKPARTTCPSPSGQSKPDSQTRCDQYPTQNAPFPVGIVESPIDEKDRKAREEEARYFNKKNLRAYEKAADAAESQFWASVGGAGLSFFAFVFLVATWWETRRTAIATRRSVEISRESFEVSQKAYLSCELNYVERRSVDDQPAFCVRAGVSVRNRGRSPAEKVKLWIGKSITTDPNAPPNLEDLTLVRNGGEMAPDDFTGAFSDIPIEHFQKVVDDTGAIYVMFRANYVDIFGGNYTIKKTWKVGFSVYPNDVADVNTSFQPEWRPYNFEWPEQTDN